MKDKTMKKDTGGSILLTCVYYEGIASYAGGAVGISETRVQNRSASEISFRDEDRTVLQIFGAGFSDVGSRALDCIWTVRGDFTGNVLYADSGPRGWG